MTHSFLIPVMGTSFTIDSPIKVAKYGIDSVVQIGDAKLCEHMRAYYAPKYGEDYHPIEPTESDFKAKRVTAYLDLIDRIIKKQIAAIKQQTFDEGTELRRYFEMLPDTVEIKKKFQEMIQSSGAKRQVVEDYLRTQVKPGEIQVNIMTKVDRVRYDKNGEVIADGSDAVTSLRGFAKSMIKGSIVFSAGLNLRVYSYAEKFKDFFPDETGEIKKKIILKVSDFRSALTQGKLFAKKGLWVSEHRIESGINCGGHAFISNGVLLGPVLEEFRQKREELTKTLHGFYEKALQLKDKIIDQLPELKITVQGGIGTYAEDQFLFRYYGVDKTGWGSPFLLVKEAASLDDETRQKLVDADEDQFYLSRTSPIGVPFHSFRLSPSEINKWEKVKEGNPGSACQKSHLAYFDEFTDAKHPLCKASKTYQRKKIEQLNQMSLSDDAYEKAYERIVEKACLCEELAAGVYVENDIPYKRPLYPAVCPGPNLVYFSKLMRLDEIVDHIYGRANMLSDKYRPHMFLKELKLYMDSLVEDIKDALPQLTEKQVKSFETFKKNLQAGIDYYKTLVPKMVEETQKCKDQFLAELGELKIKLEDIKIPTLVSS